MGFRSRCRAVLVARLEGDKEHAETLAFTTIDSETYDANNTPELRANLSRARFNDLLELLATEIGWQPDELENILAQREPPIAL